MGIEKINIKKRNWKEVSKRPLFNINLKYLNIYYVIRILIIIGWKVQVVYTEKSSEGNKKLRTWKNQFELRLKTSFIFKLKGESMKNRNSNRKIINVKKIKKFWCFFLTKLFLLLFWFFYQKALWMLLNTNLTTFCKIKTFLIWLFFSLFCI